MVSTTTLKTLLVIPNSLQDIPLFQSIPASMMRKFIKNDEKIRILGSCESFLKF